MAPDEIEDALAGLDDPEEGETDPDEAPGLESTPVSQRGDLWILADHRLIVGDATDPDDVSRLMAGEKLALVVTDPPYNVDYEGYTDEKLKIAGDKMSADQYQEFLEGSFTNYRAAVLPNAGLYVFHPSAYQKQVEDALIAAGFEVRTQLIWGKHTFGWGNMRYKFAHEPMFYAHVKGESDAWYGDKTQQTLWLEKKPAANRLHPTMKPVELIERALMNSSRRGDRVGDFFGGAGSTLIACQRLRRRCFTAEIDPIYADVILRRWMKKKSV